MVVSNFLDLSQTKAGFTDHSNMKASHISNYPINTLGIGRSKEEPEEQNDAYHGCTSGITCNFIVVVVNSFALV